MFVVSPYMSLCNLDPFSPGFIEIVEEVGGIEEEKFEMPEDSGGAASSSRPAAAPRRTSQGLMKALW